MSHNIRNDGPGPMKGRCRTRAFAGRRILAVFWGLALLSLVACWGGGESNPSPASQAGAWDPGPYVVGAYYYPWYSADSHWPDGHLFTPLLGEYDSMDPGIVTTHLAWAKYYGIDFLAVSWWGPGSFEDVALHDVILTNPAASNLRFAILYEPVGPSPGRLRPSEDGTIDLSDAGNHDLLLSDFRYLAETYFANPLYLRVDGRPVVFLFGSRNFRGKADVLAELRGVAAEAGESLYLVGDEVTCAPEDAANADLSGLDAITIYSLHGWCGAEETAVTTDPGAYFKRVDDAYAAWQGQANSQGLTFVPDILPGYDDSALRPEAGNLPIPRSPAFLDSMAQVAKAHVDPERPLLLVTSFNQWNESTQVEPSDEEGFGYLDVIRDDFHLDSADSSESTSMPGPAWWDADFRFRQPIAVTAGAAAVPSGYSVSVTLGHAGLVSSGESQDDGNDVRVLYWTGTGWQELDRVLEPGSSWDSDSTKIWFKLQAGIDASSTDGDYYLYYGNPTASDPPADERGVFQFADFFDRADSDVVGRGWAVYESTGDVDIGGDALVFNLTSDLDNRPVAEHSFGPISDGLVWRTGFNWVRSPVEQTYRVQMQLGNSLEMANPPPQADTFANAGVGPSLLWAGPDQGMRDQAGLGYQVGQAVTEAGVVSGAADVEVVANVSAGSYDLYVDDVLRASGVAFSSAQTAIDEVRFLTWQVNHVNFPSRQFDYTYVRRYVDPEPATSLASEEARS